MEVSTETTTSETVLNTNETHSVALPTGFYRVPICKNINEAKPYFFEYGACYVYMVFVHGKESDQSFAIINFTGRWKLPKPDALYLNGEKLRKYHITKDEYYDILEKYDEDFSTSCNWRGDKNIIVLKKDGMIYIQNAKLLTDFPLCIQREAYDRCIKNTDATRIVIKVLKLQYKELLTHLLQSYENTPIITSTEICHGHRNNENGAVFAFVTVKFKSTHEILDLLHNNSSDFEFIQVEILDTHYDIEGDIPHWY